MRPSVEYVAHHIAIICAGQTGTGKTHTTFGIQKMLAHAIFDTSHNLSCCAVNLEVSNSFRTTNLGMALEFVAWTIAIQILLPHILEKFTNPVWDQFFWRAANLFFTFAPVSSLKRLCQVFELRGRRCFDLLNARKPVRMLQGADGKVKLLGSHQVLTLLDDAAFRIRLDTYLHQVSVVSPTELLASLSGPIMCSPNTRT